MCALTAFDRRDFEGPQLTVRPSELRAKEKPNDRTPTTPPPPTLSRVLRARSSPASQRPMPCSGAAAPARRRARAPAANAELGGGSVCLSRCARARGREEARQFFSVDETKWRLEPQLARPWARARCFVWFTAIGSGCTSARGMNGCCCVWRGRGARGEEAREEAEQETAPCSSPLPLFSLCTPRPDLSSASFPTNLHHHHGAACHLPQAV